MVAACRCIRCGVRPAAPRATRCAECWQREAEIFEAQSLARQKLERQKARTQLHYAVCFKACRASYYGPFPSWKEIEAIYFEFFGDETRVPEDLSWDIIGPEPPRIVQSIDDLKVMLRTQYRGRGLLDAMRCPSIVSADGALA